MNDQTNNNNDDGQQDKGGQQQLPVKYDNTPHFTIQIYDKISNGLKTAYNRVYRRLEKTYDSNHFPLIFFVLSLLLNGFMDVLGYVNLFTLPKWVQFSYVFGGLIIIIAYYIGYYNKIWYKINNAKMEVIKITDYINNKMVLLFTGEDNLDNDNKTQIIGGDSLTSMDSDGDAISSFKVGRGIIYGDDDDNDLDQGQIGIISTPDDLTKIETGINPDGDKSLKQILIENHEALMSYKAKDVEDVKENIRLKENLYKKTLNQVVQDLQQSNYINNDVSLGQIYADINSDHFLANDESDTVNLEDLDDEEKKQLYARLSMDMSD